MVLSPLQGSDPESGVAVRLDRIPVEADAPLTVLLESLALVVTGLAGAFGALVPGAPSTRTTAISR